MSEERSAYGHAPAKSETLDRDALKGMLQALELMLDAAQAVSVAAGAEERARMRELVATWWTLLDERPQ
jgi:hypothetical protein